MILLGRNIKFQFLNAINNAFQAGMDKHSMKCSGQMNATRVFSYSDRKNLIDTSACLAKYLKENHPEIKEIRSITTDHIQQFLASKSTELSQASLEQYTSRLGKLERIVNSEYRSCHIDFHSIVTPASARGNGKVRNQMLSKEDFHTLYSGTTNPNLQKGLLLSYGCGLRASEICKLKSSDIDTAKHMIRIIDSKGKHSRTVSIPEPFRPAISQLAESSQERICPLQTESLQRAFRRELQKTELSQTYQNGAFHLCRKAYATNLYLDCRYNRAMDVAQSVAEVSHSLGHGDNRTDLMKQYICTPLV